MSNLQRYNKVFINVFKTKDEELGDDFEMDKVGNWDSISHLDLVSTIEEEFDVMFDSEDVLDIKSYNKGKEILKKYNILI